MRNLLLKSMLLFVFATFTGLVVGQTDVSVHVADVSKTLTSVKAKAAFDGWVSLFDMVKTELPPANVFTLTLSIPIEGDFEWGAIQDDGSDGGIWLPSLGGFVDNPKFSLAGGVITGDTLITILPVAPVDVVVAVDMSFELSKGDFDVTTDSVGISGNMNGWLFTKLTKGATDSVYSDTIQWGNYMDYKFRKNEEYEGSPNRGVYLDGTTDPVELDTVWYSNISPAPMVSIMNYVIDSTEYYSGLQYKGEITGWSLVDMYDDGTNGDQVAGDHTWTVTLDNVTAGNSYEWGAVDADENWLISGSNPVVEVTMGGMAVGDTSYVIPAWGDVAVEFNVDMNCHINLVVFDVDTSCVDVNIDGYPPVEMTNAGKGIFTTTITRFDVEDTIAFTFRMNCVFGDDYEEYPGNDVSREYVVVDGANSTGVLVFQDDIITTGACEYVPGTSIRNVQAEMVQLYPNPVYNELSVISEFEMSSINVYNITGQKVLTETGINKRAHFISTELLSDGIYVISVHGVNGEQAIHKIIKK
jgi:hypothetical protein